MAMEALSSSNELFNFIIYDTISATPCGNSFNTITTSANSDFLLNSNVNNNSQDHGRLLDHHIDHQQLLLNGGDHSMMMMIAKNEEPDEGASTRNNNSDSSKLGIVGPSSKKKKRRRKVRVCKNKEEAETQRMTHIAVERNRRKQMNEHLAVLRSLMPDSYVQRGDQASIVGGAIEFVKELEHLLQSLEAQKLKLNLTNDKNNRIRGSENHDGSDEDKTIMEMMSSKSLAPPFSQFFVYPQYTWSQSSNKYTSKSVAANAIADIEVTLIETHASIRILSRRTLRQLSKLVTGFQTLHLTILHLNVTTISPLVLYSVSVKVEEECLLTSVDDIASAVHHMLRIIEEEAALS